MFEIFAVGAGGCVGSVLRFLLTKILPNAAFPVATLAANLIAGFGIGFVTGLDGTAFSLTARQKLLVNTGVWGGLIAGRTLARTVCGA